MRSLNRREFLKWGSGALIGSMLPMPALATVAKTLDPDRRLAFYNIHTQEEVCVCYYSGGNYQPEALKEIDRILRDHRTNEVKPIDPRLLDLLHTVSSRIRPCDPFHVISGYRSVASNEMLRKCGGGGVAKKSMHMDGMAIDIRIPRFKTDRLRDLCVNLQAGGVGYYPESNFVHLDIGRFRTW